VTHGWRMAAGVSRQRKLIVNESGASSAQLRQSSCGGDHRGSGGGGISAFSWRRRGVAASIGEGGIKLGMRVRGGSASYVAISCRRGDMALHQMAAIVACRRRKLITEIASSATSRKSGMAWRQWRLISCAQGGANRRSLAHRRHAHHRNRLKHRGENAAAANNQAWRRSVGIRLWRRRVHAIIAFQHGAAQHIGEAARHGSISAQRIQAATSCAPVGAALSQLSFWRWRWRGGWRRLGAKLAAA